MTAEPAGNALIGRQSMVQRCRQGCTIESWLVHVVVTTGLSRLPHCYGKQMGQTARSGHARSRPGNLHHANKIIIQVNYHRLGRPDLAVVFLGSDHPILSSRKECSSPFSVNVRRIRAVVQGDGGRCVHAKPAVGHRTTVSASIADTSMDAKEISHTHTTVTNIRLF